MWGPKKHHLEQKKIFEKNAFFDPHLVQNAHKMAQNGVKWGGLRGQFWVFEDPRPFGTSKNVFLKKNFFFEENFFFENFFFAYFGPKGLRKISGLGPGGEFRRVLSGFVG